MRLSDDVINDARQRDGGIDEGRDNDINELLDTDQLGYGNSDPLAAPSYDDYPTLSDLTNPSQRGFLVDLLGNDNVNTIDDVVSELTAATGGTLASDWRSALTEAIDVFNINADELLEQGSNEDNSVDKLTEIVGYDLAEELRDDGNPLLLSVLYVEYGLSTDEISELLDTDEPTVRDKLTAVGLIGGKTRQQQRQAFEDNGGRLSHNDSDGGVTIDVSKM